MTTENQQIDKSKISSTNVDSSGQMRGWFKLIETIRKTDPPSSTLSNELIKSSTNSNTTNTNGHVLKSPGLINPDNLSSKSPNLISSPTSISLVSTSVQSFDDTSIINIKPTTKTKESKRSTIRRKKITIRKSTRSKEFSTINNNNNVSNDDIINVDIHQRKRQSNDSIIPLATDLESLPGHNQDESRDKRFLDYVDINTLSLHFNTCLYIDKKSFSSSYLTKQHIFKTRHNILNKIFKLYHIKTYENDSKIDQKNQETKSNSSLLSSTSSFKTDWSVNRRSSSSYRREPKNMFHILQLNPKKDLFLSTNNKPTTKLSIEHQQHIDYEHMKDLLIRTYYPHFHIAVQSGNYFGSKSKLPIKHHDLPISTTPESPPIESNETIAITLKSPPSITEQEIKTRGRKSKYKKLKDKPLPIISVERRVSEEIPPVDIKESMIVSTSTEISLPSIVENEINNNNNRKRKKSATINLNINERKKKKFIQSPSPEFSNEYQDIAHSDSDEDVLPDELPKSNFIKNGLRSNYYKTTTDSDVKSTSKNRGIRRRQQLSGSLPPFYKGIFESDDEKLSYIDYRLPFDIYWFSQKQAMIINSSPLPSKSINQQQNKKKINQPKQKQQSLFNKKIIDLNIEQKILPSKINDKKQEKLININKNLIKIEELTEHEKQIILQTSIFLKRNLRRIKERQELKDKHNNQHKQHVEEQPLPLFFSQNYYHPNIIQETDNSNLSHKDLLNLFYNHIRRSHFYKTGQCSLELIDQTCYYAQLAQLNLILNEIFDLLLNYRCQNSDIYPSNALKKCPLKRLFPMYYELILKPIDLTIIRNKLDNGEYLSYDLFEQDLLLLFNNAITYCGDDSDVGRAVKELEIYFIDVLKINYQPTINLFHNMNNENKNQRNLNILQNFITYLHKKEIINGQIREILYDIIYTIDNSTSIIYKTVLTNTTNTNRTTKNISTNDYIVHCRCGSMYDETSLVQCYAWQVRSVCFILKFKHIRR
ncbi:unnamed protein product [Rotaria sp. Silwood1]|nr:unnamed protein product [Rotaria sp. Silwood1]